jgi:hypothetical protein
MPKTAGSRRKSGLWKRRDRFGMVSSSRFLLIYVSAFQSLDWVVAQALYHAVCVRVGYTAITASPWTPSWLLEFGLLE